MESRTAAITSCSSGASSRALAMALSSSLVMVISIHLRSRLPQMVEPVSGANGLGGEITAILGIDRRMERHAAADLDTGGGKAVQFRRIVGQQHGATTAEQLEPARSDSIVT